MSRSHELIKHVKINSCLCHFDGKIYPWYELYHCTTELAYSLSVLISAMLLTPLLLHGSAEVNFQSAQPAK